MAPDPVRWLDEDEQVAWRAFLEATSLLLNALERQLKDDSALSHADYEILVRLSEAPNHRIRMSELADSAMVSRSRLSHAFTRLEGEGLVARETCRGDLRGTLAVLTDRGYKALHEAAKGHVTAVRELMFDQLSATQVAQLRRISCAIRSALRESD